MTAPQLGLFGADAAAAELAARHRALGFRTTPPELVGLLCSLPEWRDRPGDVLDLGVGGGALCRAIEERQPIGRTRSWILLDVRPEAIASMEDWQPQCARVERAVHDATTTTGGWPLAHALPYITRVVSNPPWGVQQCPACRALWPARRGTACAACRLDGRDLAQAMVRGVMQACPRADVWVLHTADWPFHPERCRFWGDDAPGTHRFAGRDELSGLRVAYGQPDGSPVARHNRPSVWYHWVPARRYRGQHVRFHPWPLQKKTT